MEGPTSFYDAKEESLALAKACWMYEQAPTLVEAVRRDHKDCSWGDHGFAHIVAVAQYVYLIAGEGDEGSTKFMAGVAAICHNVQHIFSGGKNTWIERIAFYLNLTNLSSGERAVVLDAILNHNEQNSFADGPVDILLKDAYRLSWLGPIGLVRAIAKWPDLPIMDLRLGSNNPSAFPLSLGARVGYLLQLSSGNSANYLRTLKARAFAIKHLNFLRDFQFAVEAQFSELGLFPLNF